MIDPTGVFALICQPPGRVDWFNHTRIHSQLNYRTPAEIETEHYRVHNKPAQQPLADQPAL